MLREEGLRPSVSAIARERAGSCYARRVSVRDIRERAGSFVRLKSGLTVITSASAVPLFLVDPDEEYRLRFCVKTPHSPS